MSAVASFFGNLAGREKALADFFRQGYHAYQAGAQTHDPQQLTTALGGMQSDWDQMKGLPQQSFAPNPPQPPVERGRIAAAMPGK